jgi:nucleotide-binding universal stress UspA family protein
MTANPFTGPILCPVDLSSLSAKALRVSALIAKRCACPVTALYAQSFEVPAYVTTGQAERIEEERRESLEAARATLRRFVDAAIEGAQRPDIRIEEGDPKEAILRAARSAGSGLIVMGTHVPGGIQRWMAGSVAEEVVHASGVPVLTVREQDRTDAISKIVCAVNDSEVSRNALAHAVKLSRCLGAQLYVIHVLEPDGRRAIRDLCAWIGEQKPPGCELQEVTRSGRAVEEIRRFAEEAEAGLLVIGAERRLFADRTAIGATAAQLIRQAPCALLTIVGGAIKDAVPDQVEQAAE